MYVPEDSSGGCAESLESRGRLDSPRDACVGPCDEVVLVDVEPVLLRSDNHTGPHDAHESDDLVGSEGVLVDKVGADETTSTAEASFAVDGNDLVEVGHFLDEADELPDHGELGTSTIFEEHVDVLDADVLKLRSVIELRIEADDYADGVVLEVVEHMGEGRCDDCTFAVEGIGLRCVARLYRARKGYESRAYPVKVTLVYTLIVFVFLEVEGLDVDDLCFLSPPEAVDKVLYRECEVGLTVACVAEHHEGRISLGKGRNGEVWGPVLDKDHVAGQDASGVSPGARVCLRVEDDWLLGHIGVLECERLHEMSCS